MNYYIKEDKRQVIKDNTTGKKGSSSILKLQNMFNILLLP